MGTIAETLKCWERKRERASRISLSTQIESRTTHVSACGTCTRLREQVLHFVSANSAHRLIVAQVYGLRDGIYLKRPAAVI